MRRASTRRGAAAKLILAVLLDAADLAAHRVIGFGVPTDVVLAGVGFLLFGWKGLLQLWEVADGDGRVAGYVPTLTLLALIELRAAGRSSVP